MRHRSIRSILIQYELRPRPYYYDEVRKAAAVHTIDLVEWSRKDVKIKQLDNNIRRASAFSDETTVRNAVANSSSYKQACEKLGVKPAGNNYRRLDLACGKFGIIPPQKRKTGPKSPLPRYAACRYALDIDVIVKTAETGGSPEGALSSMGIPVTRWLVSKTLLIARDSGSPFRDSSGGRKSSPGRKYKKTLDELLRDGTSPLSRNSKDRLIETGILPNRCSECKIPPIWNNKSLVLQLDHIDGNISNNKIENLRLLCPNCHTQTETYTNKKRGR